MDPIANLNEQRKIAAAIRRMDDRWNDTMTPMNEDETTEYIDNAGRLAELVIALDEWRKAGGFDPYKA